jgi:hypothetical protein
MQLLEEGKYEEAQKLIGYINADPPGYDLHMRAEEKTSNTFFARVDENTVILPPWHVHLSK